MGRIAPEELQKLHSEQKALLGPARARLGDLMAALVALNEWKLVEELQRWAREELDLEEEQRESLFRGMLSSLVSQDGDLRTWFVNPLMEAVKKARYLTKDGKVNPSKHREVWGWMAEGLRSLEADLCIAFLEARGSEAQEEISWFLKRFAKEVAKVAFMSTRQSVVMGKPANFQSAWSLPGTGIREQVALLPSLGTGLAPRAPLPSLRRGGMASFTSLPLSERRASGPRSDGGENVFTHAPSVFGSHGFKPVGAPLRWFAMQRGSSCETRRQAGNGSKPLAAGVSRW